MFSRIKGNGHFIVQTYLFQFAAAFLSLIITFTTSSISDPLFILGSVLCVLFYFYLEYNLFWDLGTKDRLKIDGGRLEYLPIASVGLSLIHNIPNILLGIIIVITNLLRETTLIEGVQVANTAENIYSVVRTVAMIWESPYWGLLYAVQYFAPAFLLYLIPTFIIEYLGYSLGVKNIDIFAKLGLKKMKKQ